jgi:hypothetical protein
MSKRDMPEDASEETKFRIIMAGLMQNDRTIQPKDGRVGEQEKWRAVADKKMGVTSGYIVTCIPETHND